MSPYSSDAQRKKFHQLLKEGKISAETVAEFDQASKGLVLPAHVEKTVKTQIKTGTPLHSFLTRSKKSAPKKRRR